VIRVHGDFRYKRRPGKKLHLDPVLGHNVVGGCDAAQEEEERRSGGGGGEVAHRRRSLWLRRRCLRRRVLHDMTGRRGCGGAAALGRLGIACVLRADDWCDATQCKLIGGKACVCDNIARREISAIAISAVYAIVGFVIWDCWAEWGLSR
jgi:hypothetical protein